MLADVKYIILTAIGFGIADLIWEGIGKLMGGRR